MKTLGATASAMIAAVLVFGAITRVQAHEPEDQYWPTASRYGSDGNCTFDMNEHLTRNEKVVSSILTGGSTSFLGLVIAASVSRSAGAPYLAPYPRGCGGPGRRPSDRPQESILER